MNMSRRLVMRLWLMTILTTSVESFSVGFLPSFLQPKVQERELQQPQTPVLETDEEFPTSTPTESPAPSPSPSFVPTEHPTITSKPTARPTEPPTESPAPSPSPSFVPTFAPTKSPSATPSFQPTTTPFPTGSPSSSPSDVPTNSPSVSPTNAPSVSFQPSDTPTASPSVSPTNAPSVSKAPSQQPSFSPSASMAPSAAPTYVDTLSANWTVTLPLAEVLEDSEIEALEAGTEQWMQQLKLSNNGYLSDAMVNLISQKTVSPTPFDRKLQEVESEKPQYTLLELDLAAYSTYTGPDTDFSLSELEMSLQRNDPEWIHILGNHDPLFLPLRESADVAGVGSEEPPFENIPATKSGMSPGLYGFTIFAAVVAVLLGIVASVYSIRHHNHKLRGTELVSPSAGKAPLPTWSSEDDGVVEEEVKERKPDPGCDMPFGIDSLCSGPPEAEDPQPQQKKESREVFRAQAVSKRDRESTEINFGRMSELFGQREDGSNMSSAYADSRISDKPPPNTSSYLYPHNRVEPDPGSDDQEIMLTKSMGGTLGARAVDGSTTGNSDYSSQAKLFLQNMLGTKPADKPSEGANVPSGIARTTSYDSVLRRPGLYDVLAPAGPIGIVVDTTKEGPVVHSLKRTSPMLGLISPGDLVVGLDDQDTRSMTAATLTRLMARKSSQKERKITLLTSENYH